MFLTLPLGLLEDVDPADIVTARGDRPAVGVLDCVTIEVPSNLREATVTALHVRDVSPATSQNASLNLQAVTLEYR